MAILKDQITNNKFQIIKFQIPNPKIGKHWLKVIGYRELLFAFYLLNRSLE